MSQTTGFVLTVFYDAGCGLCQRSQLLLSRLDVWQRLSWQNLYAENVQELYPQIPPVEQRKQGMLALNNQTGQLWQGVPAIAYILKQLPWPCPWAGAVLLWPPLQPLTHGVYAWVARNRHRWLPPLPEGKSEEGSTCKL